MTGDRFAGKTALVSGGASGIGAETARRMVAQGGRVLIADIQEDKGRALATQLGDAARFARLDVRDDASWAAAFKAAQDAFGPVTSVVNSAGISVPGTIEDISLDDFRRTTTINLEGVFLGCKHGIAALKGGKGGSIVNVCSTLGVRAGAIFAAYCASKGGVRMLTKSVALHCAEQGYDIRVNNILPGAIHTEMVEGYIAQGEAAGATRDAVIGGFADVHPMKRLGRPEEPANAILFLISDESSYTTGAEIAVDGGYLA